jgi:hypothetical protein
MSHAPTPLSARTVEKIDRVARGLFAALAVAAPPKRGRRQFMHRVIDRLQELVREAS